MTSCCTLKASYTRYLYIGFLAATLIHAAAFALWPEYVPKTYKLREVIIPKWVDFESEIEIPPKPPEIKPPEVPVDIEASDDADPEETIQPTVFRPEDPPIKLPAHPEELGRFFYHYETEPELLRRAIPDYPELARKAEMEGSVVVHVTIDETGKVIDAWIAYSQADIFNTSAIEAAYKYRFTPALQNGTPVKATISVPFRFSLTN
jgi:protein TonB